MKQVLLYLLLPAYTVFILKPALPSVADRIAHVFWYSSHMATVHYEQGHYHVHLEYAAAAKKGTSEKNNTLKADDSMGIHLPVHEYRCLIPVNALPFFHSFACKLCLHYSHRFYPPPRHLS